MTLKWIGAALVVIGCGGFGFRMAHRYKMELRDLRELDEAIRWMICELEYRQSPLPQLIRGAALRCVGPLKGLFTQLSTELEAQISPNAVGCMEAALIKCALEEGLLVSNLRKLGRTLGEFHLQGQISSLQAVLLDCERDITQLEQNRPQRIRSYQTLGFCAGAALAILFV